MAFYIHDKVNLHFSVYMYESMRLYENTRTGVFTFYTKI